MKKYIKPTAEVIELSVKESLSKLPSTLELRKVNRTAQITNQIAASVYAVASIAEDKVIGG